MKRLKIDENIGKARGILTSIIPAKGGCETYLYLKRGNERDNLLDLLDMSLSALEEIILNGGNDKGLLYKLAMDTLKSRVTKFDGIGRELRHPKERNQSDNTPKERISKKL